MIDERSVPDWYKLQCRLISSKPTRFLLFQYHRIKKRLHKIHEHLRLGQQPRNLRHFEKRVFSQNGEDGILTEIFRRIGLTDRFFVEFGVQDGTQCCTRNLLENAEWSGVWIECSDDHVSNAKRLFEKYPVKIINRFLTAENIVSVFQDARVPGDFDLMVIDVDGNDYWMWNALAGNYRPRVVMTEYNGTFGPVEEWVMPYNPEHRYDETAYFGASLSAFAKFGRRFGYRLVGCDSMGVNAFFVREDASEGAFDGLDKSAAFHYVAPYYDWWFGHPVKHF